MDGMKFKILETMKHINRPKIVGIKNAATPHFMLPVSFFIVQQVVPHGKCISEKIITQIAVM